MPLQPLQFDTIANIKASLRRLQQHHLLSIRKFDTHYQVEVKDGLADELLISESGDTYLLSEVIALDRNEMQGVTVQFVVRANGQVVKASKVTQLTAPSFLHNQPLANVLETLRFNKAKNKFALKLQQTKLFPFPVVFPVIDQDENTEDSLSAIDYMRFCRHRDAKRPYEYLIPNNALEALHHGASKTKKQREDFKLGLFVMKSKFNEVSESLPRILPNYDQAVRDYPKYRNKTTPELRRNLSRYKWRVKRASSLMMTCAWVLTGLGVFAMAGVCCVPMYAFMSLAIEMPFLGVPACVLSLIVSYKLSKLVGSALGSMLNDSIIKIDDICQRKINRATAATEAVCQYNDIAPFARDLNQLERRQAAITRLSNRYAPRQELPPPAQPATWRDYLPPAPSLNSVASWVGSLFSPLWGSNDAPATSAENITIRRI